jgi:hypothetical protein
MECPICYEPMTDTSNVYVTKCNHSFHKECFEEWSSLPEGSICPMCRTPLRPQLALIFDFELNFSTYQIETLVDDSQETSRCCYVCATSNIRIFIIPFVVLICFSQFWTYLFIKRFPSKPYFLVCSLESVFLVCIFLLKIFCSCDIFALSDFCFIAHLVKVIFCLFKF